VAGSAGVLTRSAGVPPAAARQLHSLSLSGVAHGDSPRSAGRWWTGSAEGRRCPSVGWGRPRRSAVGQTAPPRSSPPPPPPPTPPRREAAARDTDPTHISNAQSRPNQGEPWLSLSLGACNTEFTEEYSLVFGLHRTVHQCQHGAARTPREGGQQACQPCSRRATHTHAHPRYRETLAHEERRDETREWSTGEGPRRETDSGMVVWSHTPLAKAFSVARKLVLERRIRLSASAGQGIKAVSYAWNGKSRVPFWCSKASRRDLPFQAYDRRPKWIGK
jgi:hypothetical protein